MIGAKETARVSTGGVPRHFQTERCADANMGDLKPYMAWIEKNGLEILPVDSGKTGTALKQPKVNEDRKYDWVSLLQSHAVNEESEIEEEEMARRLESRDAREIFFALHDRGWLNMDGEDAFFKEFIFASFDEAWSFMTQTVEVARSLHRYPDWHQAYNCVTVSLPGSLCHGVSLDDARLAQFMETVSDALTK